jgi:hypothetical protein
MIMLRSRDVDRRGGMDLEIQQNDKFQQREWRFNRVGWALIVVFLLAGLTGLLGPGPLSWSTDVGDAGLITVEHQRIGHLEADDALTVTVASEAVTADTVTLVLGRGWVDAMDIDGISPAPDSERSTPAGLELQMSAQPAAELQIRVTYRPGSMGQVPGSASIDGDAVAFDQFIIP